ncbi:hypothetical protein GKZ28_18010 [Clostridium chromiireducens]|uniref:Uncharacterized protein n=1 Tax=Clostridium chromiireducens TaxID=225345 RepID=A0A964RPD3_9CLOT|nr:hypothetical protein [Clostridium chromiireducens]MVX65579.1 hypothetical protein [Clostridium chromiireducens]
MENELFQEIQKIIHSVIDDSLSNDTIVNKHIIIYQKAPAHFDSTEIPINFIQPTVEKLSDTIKENLLNISEKLAIMKYGDDDNVNVSNNNGRIVQALIRSSQFLYKEVQLLKIYNEKQTLDSLIFNEASKIMKWINTTDTIHMAKLYIVPSINTELDIKISNYKLQHENFIDKSKTAYYSGSSNQEALTRALNTSVITLKRDLTSENINNFSEEINIILIALSFGLKGIYSIDDISISPYIWEFAPDSMPTFHRVAWPKYHYENSFVKALEFYSSYLKGNDLDFFYKITDKDVKAVDEWYYLLQNNRKSIFSFTQILNGFRDVAEANAYNFNYLNKYNKALNGIYLMISGLEGLNSECKPKDEYGNKIKARKTFVDCWSKLLSRQIRKNNSYTLLNNIRNINKLFFTIYALRSDIAHSDSANMETNCKEIKKQLGDWYIPGDYSAPTVAVCLMKIISWLMDEFIQENNLLSELLIGKLPR